MIKKLSSSLTYEDAIDMLIQSQNQLIGSIQENEMMVDFNRQLILEDVNEEITNSEPFGAKHENNCKQDI